MRTITFGEYYKQTIPSVKDAVDYITRINSKENVEGGEKEQ
jgi:hypothetical protein